MFEFYTVCIVRKAETITGVGQQDIFGDSGHFKTMQSRVIIII